MFYEKKFPNFFFEKFFSTIFFLEKIFIIEFFLANIFFTKIFLRRFFSLYIRENFFCIWCLRNNVFCDIFYSKFCLLRIFLFCNFGVRKKNTKFFLRFFFQRWTWIPNLKIFLFWKKVKFSLIVLLDFLTYYYENNNASWRTAHKENPKQHEKYHRIFGMKNYLFA